MGVGLIVFSSVVTGICHISCPQKLKRIGFRSVLFFVITTFIAILNSLWITSIINPGVGLNLSTKQLTQSVKTSLLDHFIQLLPKNPFAALSEGNIIQVMIFATLFACALLSIKEKGKPVLEFFESLQEVMIRLTQFIMRLAPYASFALMATSAGSLGLNAMKKLAIYLLCNYAACALQLLVVFPSILFFLARVNPLHFYRSMQEAVLCAFSTCSSSATLPISLNCVRNHLGVPKEIAGFVMSIGSTINMNGAAAGQICCALFISQAYGIPLDFGSLLLLIVFTFLSAVGAAGIPGASIMMMSIILHALGLPLEGILLVAGVDRLREMLSTIVNVLGDAVAAVYVANKELSSTQDSMDITKQTLSQA
jgi:Na+/H+-dicarboxylate symporter